APKRIYGYYVLPFLMGEGFAGRVDLKADRKTSTLLVQAAYVEAGGDPGTVAEALVGELHHMARWLGLDGVTVAPKGGLAKPLRQALRTSRRALWSTPAT
ncbi:MAG: winged helix DNA-binding domain-containing protein, partial [Actinobacteria bacterium]|nr:winged helix DNA-binding domain-containing protein [Actinomycetota bacterium]